MSSCVIAMETVVTGDGHTKMMMMINRQHPGPSIVVYEGQEVTYYNILVCDKPIRYRYRYSGMKLNIYKSNKPPHPEVGYLIFNDGHSPTADCQVI